MPQETLSFPPAYCFIGAYRLAHDSLLWKPMWKECRDAFKKAGLIALLWALITWPIQRLIFYYFMQGSAKVSGMSALYHTVTTSADKIDGSQDSRILGFIGMPSLTTFAAMMFVLGQVHYIMEFWMRRKLRACRGKAYEATVLSRGKPAEWWTPYVEEWEDPPYEKATRNTKKQKLYMKLATPLIRMFILRVALLPLSFIPFLGLFVSAAIRSLTLARQLHTLLFARKKMTILQIELWVTERQFEYRSFGLAAALLESIPILGMAFSISNRVGAAMYAHDLEKRQQAFRQGTIKKLPRSETHSSRPKIAFSAQDEGANFPGGMFSTSVSSSNKPAESEDGPPAYTVSQATEMMGGSGGPEGTLGHDDTITPEGSKPGLKKRAVPSIPKGKA